MKHLLIFILAIFIFAGCAQKEIVIDTKTKEVVVEKEVEEEVTLEDFSEIITDDDDFKVAVIFPSKVVGKYATSTVNTILGYLLFKNEKFELETFDSVNQDKDNIELAFSEARDKGYKKVIALYTQSALDDLFYVSGIEDLEVYFPIIKKDAFLNKADNFTFGAISYEEQFKSLMTFSNNINTTFYEDSSIGNRLNNIYSIVTPDVQISKAIDKNNNSYKNIVDDELLNETTLMINTPIIKTSILLSQLRAHDIKPTMILSTQLNYDPILVSLTQFEDRVNFITASSIEKTDDNLQDVISLMGSDITYNWVNYSSLVGINQLFSKNVDNIIKNNILNNQVQYEVNLFNSTEYGFQKIETN